MFYTVRLKKNLLVSVAAICVLLAAVFLFAIPKAMETNTAPASKNTIKWVDFDVPSNLLAAAMEMDIASHCEETKAEIDWVDALAYLAAKNGGDFSRCGRGDLEALAQKLEEGTDIDTLGAELKYYAYYKEAYGAALGGFVGEYELETENGWEKCYGLKAYFPIAKNFASSEYDDFGVGRSYGYQRKHLGHDLMAETGTPVVAVESGVVEAMGWNQYGGWRVGIRSFDGKRYHYYAHLRKDRPYAAGLEEGQVVMAGDVIGYVGRTGYSPNENTNNIKTSHLHYGLQLIFDESQKEGMNEIWIDVYDICDLLKKNRCETVRNDETKEWSRVTPYREEIPKKRFPDL